LADIPVFLFGTKELRKTHAQLYFSELAVSHYQGVLKLAHRQLSSAIQNFIDIILLNSLPPHHNI